MKKLFITSVITLIGLFNLNASAQGYLLDGGTPLSETKTIEYLREICGAKGSGTSWTVSMTPNKNYFDYDLTGSVYFVKVNDYWVGLGSDESKFSVYDQVNKGVTEIAKIGDDQMQKTENGAFYTYPATDTNKFFFMQRRSSRKGSKESDSKSRYAFAWYDEWSYIINPTEDPSVSYSQKAESWADLKDGKPFAAPHNCGKSLERNHYIALSGTKVEDANHYDFTAYIYIPNNIPTKYTTGGNAGVISGDNVPYVFFYAVKLQEVADSKLEKVSTGKYNVTLNWNTAFDLYANDKENHPEQYNTTYENMQEHYILERSYDNTTWETVSNTITVKENGVKVATNKTTVDTGLKTVTDGFGYTVYYRVTSEVQKTDGTVMSSTTSNTVSVVIPGTIPFKLTLAGTGSSSYDVENYKNTFTNTLNAAALSTEDEIDIANVEAGSVLGLYRVGSDDKISDTTPLTSVTINTKGEYQTLGALVSALGTAGKYTDATTIAAGDANTAAYQLMMTIKDGETKYSNILRIDNPALNLASVKAHRSGTPDAATCAEYETYHSTISFSASTEDAGSGYYLYCNGEQIANFVYSNGTFRLASGSIKSFTYADGTLTITDIREGNRIALGESGYATDNTDCGLKYAVAFYDSSSQANTYGSEYNTPEFEGLFSELVATLSTSGNMTVANNINRQSDGNYDYNISISQSFTVNRNVAFSSNYDDTEIGKFTIYYKKYGKNTDYATIDEAPFIEYTNATATTDGETITFTDKFYSLGQEENGKPFDANTQKTQLLAEVPSYQFYVKMLNTNNEEKNSAIVEAEPTSSTNVWTAINTVEAQDMDVTVNDNIVTVAGIDGQITIVNMAGQTVAKAVGNGNETEIEVDAAGVYVVVANNMKPTKILIK